MRLRVRFLGEGTQESPYYVPLPTYSLLEPDYDKKLAIVEIPDDTHPFKDGEANGKRETHPVHGEIQTTLTTAAQNALHKHLDSRYREHKGEYRPELA